jgi:hypothetical protein
MMDDVKLNKEELLEKIRKNMETHQGIYETAVEEFNKQQIELLENMVTKAREGKPFDRLALSRLPVPENHMDDYKRAVRLLEMEVRKEIKLDERDFNRYVLDEWEWQRNFAANTQSYAASAMAR